MSYGCVLFFPEKDAHGYAVEVEMAAELVFEKIFIRGFDGVGIVGEKGEGGHHGRDLRYELDLYGVPAGHGGRVALDLFQHDLVELRGGDAALAVLIYFQRLFHTLENAFFIFGGNEDDRHVGERRGLLLDLLFVIAGGVRLLLHEIPFVDQQHDAFALAGGEAEDADVLRGDALLRVYDLNADVRFIHGADRADDGVKFQVFMHILFLPQTGGVYQDKFFPELLIVRMNGIARRAGNVGDDGPFLAHQRVQQGGLAGVRLTDDGEFGQCSGRFRRFLRRVGDMRGNGVQQLAGAAAGDGRQEERLVEAEAVEFGGLQPARGVVHLVDHQQHRLGGPAQQPGHVLVLPGDARDGVADEQQQVGLVHRDQHLPADLPLEHIVGMRHKAAGVYEVERPAVPVGDAVLPVARHPAHIVHDRFALLQQTVEQR